MCGSVSASECVCECVLKGEEDVCEWEGITLAGGAMAGLDTTNNVSECVSECECADRLTRSTSTSK